MATYLLMNIIFAAATLALLRVRPRRPSRVWWIMLTALLVLTAVFDSLMVYFAMIDYDPAKILGIRIGLAPIEDFFYAIYAAIIVPFIWNKLGRKHD